MNKIVLPKISKYHYELCRLFAEESYITSVVQYHKRHQENIEKIKRDILYGKCAEFMVYSYYTERETPITFPDIDIYYNKQKKSFDPDFIINKEYNLHVKSRVEYKDFPISWVFQKQDFLVQKPTEKDYIAFCVLSKKESYMYVTKASKVTYEKPNLEHLSGNKVCVYQKTLMK
jgi:hypothetical protein